MLRQIEVLLKRILFKRISSAPAFTPRGSASSLYVIPDTHLSLHYKRWDQVDWCAIADSNEIVLLVTPILVRELEAKKAEARSGTLRKRAESSIRWLASLRRDETKRMIRPGVYVDFLPHDPSVNFAELKLREGVADDWFIATAIDVARNTLLPHHVAIASMDFGMEMKIAHWRITHIALPDDCRLADELSEETKELNELRRENAELKVRIPDLAFCFDERRNHMSLAVEKPQLMSVDEQVAVIRKQYPKKPVPEKATNVSIENVRSLDIANLPNDGIERWNASRYNKQIDEFVDAWIKFITDMNEWRKRNATIQFMTFWLYNDGRAPATDIRMHLDFPDGVTALEEGKLEKPPKAPPKSFAMFAARMPSTSPEILREVDMDWNRKAMVDKDGGVTFCLDRLSHTYSIDMRPLALRISGDLTGFDVGYRLTAAELPKPVDGTLNIKLEKSANA